MAEKILLTGFGAFRDIGENPSEVLVRRAAGEGWGEFHVLEVSYAAVDKFVAGLAAASFDTWLMVGVHGFAERMHLETVAKNLCGPGADVRGVVGGPGMIDPSLPPQVAGNLFGVDLEGDVSTITVDAGGYLCNYLFFKGVTAFPNKRIGFLHVPRVEVMGIDEQWAEFERILGQLS